MLKVIVYYIIFQYLYLVIFCIVFIFVWLNDKQFCKIVFIGKIFEKYFIKYMYIIVYVYIILY